MSKSTDRIVDAQNAILETAESVGVRALESAVELLQLNLQAAQLAANATTETAKASGSTRQGGAAAAAAQQFDPSLAFAYQRRAWEIVSRASADVMPLLAQQAQQLQTFYNEMTSATMSVAPAANGPLSALVRSPLEVMQQTMERTSAAFARAASTAAETVGSAVNDAEEVASRGRKAA